MPEARGRLSKGQTAKLELNGDTISVSVLRGFIGKKMVPYKDLPLGDVNSVELYEGEKPFTGSQRLRLMYTAEDGGDELSFFTAQEDHIREIYGLIGEDIARREEQLRRQICEYMETRELQLNMLYQDLELVDSLFDFAAHLGGEIDWAYLYDALGRMRQVQLEMEALGSSHYRFSFDGLESELGRRHVEEMKREAAGLLEVALQGVTEASSNPVEWFNVGYHHLFVSTLFLLRNRELSGLTGAVDDSDERRLGQQVEALIALVGSECLEMTDFGAEGFDRARLYSLVDLLVGVPFEPRS
ncbi:hypothetical protein KAV46_04750 [Candidatus Bathyarchaeota archaeon]|nr:hypothetical protein [Candidatus Bathyarchaeota archaeon]